MLLVAGRPHHRLTRRRLLLLERGTPAFRRSSAVSPSIFTWWFASGRDSLGIMESWDPNGRNLSGQRSEAPRWSGRRAAQDDVQLAASGGCELCAARTPSSFFMYRIQKAPFTESSDRHPVSDECQ